MTLVWRRRRRLYAVLLVWIPVYLGAFLLANNARFALQSMLLNLFSNVDTIAEFRLVTLASDALADVGLVLLEAALAALLLRRLIGHDRTRPDGSGFIRTFLPIGALFLIVELAFTTAFQGLRTGELFGGGEALRGLSTIALGAAYVWVFARLCLVLPYAAVGDGWQARRSWRQTSAIWFRLSVVLAMLFFADVLLSTVIWRWTPSIVAAIGPNAEGLTTIVGVAMISVKNAMTYTVFVSFVVAVFGTVSGRWVHELPGGPPSPNEMAGVFD